MNKLLYMFNANGVFDHAYSAQESPLEEGVYIVDHSSSTDIEPPTLAENETCKFVNGAWHVIPDFRGKTQYFTDGTESEVIEAGALADGYSLTPPPLVKERDVRVDRDARINAVAWQYERNAREVRLGLAPTDNIATLDKYVQDLAGVPDQAGFPENVQWPTL